MIKENLASVEAQILEACQKAGRRREDVTLIAVSKTNPVQRIKEAYDLGVRDFGENKVKEMLGKEPQLPEDKSQAELKLTKKVVYKNTPIRVNSVYYIGIFDDAAHTKIRYKKALQFKNASEMSATLKINLYKLKSKEVTFYFAEVDKDGKVVESGGATGYEISQNKGAITLNAKNMKDELVITDSVIQGSKRERQLTDPGSGFAGDTAALATAQKLENDKNAGINTVTGDKTPIVPWATALVLSGFAAALVFAYKKRRRA